MANKFRESNILFTFPDNYHVIKFDESSFYRSFFNYLPGGKGVDFIVDTDSSILLIEVKNCRNHERENRKRTRTRGTNRTANAETAVSDFFEDEIPAKIAMSLSCLIGAYTKRQNTPCAQELDPYFQAIISDGIANPQKDIVIIFVLEGDFGCRTRTKGMIMDRIQDNIRKALKWLSVKKVHVVDTNTYRGRDFTMEALL